MSCPSSIRRRDSNPRPLDCEPPPITTRPGLDQDIIADVDVDVVVALLLMFICCVFAFAASVVGVIIVVFRPLISVTRLGYF